MVAEAIALGARLALGKEPQALTSRTFSHLCHLGKPSTQVQGPARPSQGTLPRRPPDIGWEHVPPARV